MGNTHMFGLSNAREYSFSKVPENFSGVEF